MARLRSLKPNLSSLRPRLRAADDRAGRIAARDEQPYRRWYKTSRWQALRWRVLLRDLFTCQWPGCGKLEADTSLLVADHRVPHRGDERLFWDEANLWCLCRDCHASHKQRAERDL